MVLILLIFIVLVTSAAQATLGEGAGGDPLGNANQNGDCNQTQEQEQQQNGTCEQSREQLHLQDCSCNQTQERKQIYAGLCTKTKEQKQEQNGEGEQNQEQNGEGNQNQEQNGEGNCSGNQNQEQNGEGEPNQEQNGDSNCSGDQNQEQNGEGNQNQEQNGEGNQNQEQNGECNQNQEQNGDGNCSGDQNQKQNGEGNQNQEQNGECNQNHGEECNCNCTQEQKQQQNQNGTCGCDCDGNMYQYKWYGSEGNCMAKHQGDGEGNEWRHRYQNEIKAGVENGTVVMETTFQKQERYMLQENNHYQMGMEVELLEVEGNKVRVRVRAEFQEGKVVAINIAQNVLRFGEPGQHRVYFDGEEVNKGTVEEVVAGKGAQAKYVGEIGDGGAQFLVYIPHFSEHIIEIESLTELVKEELFTKTNYIVMGFSILALVGLSGHIYRIGKSKL